MTCKDCLHFKDVCEEHGLYFEDEYIKGVAFSEDIKDLCHGFKNKAGFVEVVRCKDCKYVHINSSSGLYHCKRRGYYSEEVKPIGFCSYGKRR